jgi:hypothetical protein
MKPDWERIYVQRPLERRHPYWCGPWQGALCSFLLAEFLNTKFIHLVVCLTTGPKPLPNRALHIVRSSASSFKWQYRLLKVIQQLPTFSSSSSCHFYPPFIFPSINRCRRQFLRKMWPIQLAYRFLISCRIFLCTLTLLYKIPCCIYCRIATG